MNDKSARNFILATFLKNYKKTQPFCFYPNDDFFRVYEPKVKAILEDETSKVLLLKEPDIVTPYGCPFNLVTRERINGWCLIGKNGDASFIYSVYVSKIHRAKGLGKKLIDMAYIHLNQPKEIEIVFPTKLIFNAVRSILKDKSRIYVRTDKLK